MKLYGLIVYHATMATFYEALAALCRFELYCIMRYNQIMARFWRAVVWVLEAYQRWRVRS